MFVLRRITPETIEINTCLGIDYVFVLKERNPDEFKRTTELWKCDEIESIYGVITFDEGESIMPLYKDSHYYIMTSNGQTFAKV
jgi:hypothetical protein